MDLEQRVTGYADSISSTVIVVPVTADGATDVSGTIQTVLTGLASNRSRSYEVVVEPVYPATPGALIYLNNKVRISSNYTKVKFRAPILLGTGCDPDGFGCLSMRGTVTSTTTTTAAVRGQSVIVVASATGIVAGTMLKINDADTSGGATAGYKSEVAEVVYVSGTSVYLDHPLHQTYTGTITVSLLAPITASGFEDAYCTFTGQQAASGLFPAKALVTRYCYYRNVHFKGTTTDSWSREALNVRDSYRALVDQCTASMSWDYGVASTYSYGFSTDGSTACLYRAIHVSNLRHGFTSDKGSAGIIYSQCRSDNSLASGFDLHGNWTRDILYVGCVATASPDTLASNDTQQNGFLAGNTTFINGVQYITYSGCVAHNFGPYTTNLSANGSGFGFGIVDGCSNIVYNGCRIYDSQTGISIKSNVGAPITNVGIYNCEFNNMQSSDASGRPPVPISVTAGISPGDVNGLVIDGCKFVNGGILTSSVRVYGTSGNTLTDIVVSNCIWSTTQGVSGQHALDCKYLDHLIVKGNIFNYTRRGVNLTSCVGALVVDNVYNNLTEPGECIRDSGGNTNMIFAKNIINPAPTALGTASTSTGAFIDLTSPVGVPATSLPTLPAGSIGVQAWDTTAGKPVWWNGTAWVRATVS